MTRPPEPPRPGRDDDKTVVVPLGQPGPRRRQDAYPQQYPGPPGSYPPPGYPPPGYPPGQQQNRFDQPTANAGYNPYGQQQYPDYSQFPAAYPAEVVPPRRPGYLYLAFILLLLSALPFLAGGLLLLFGSAGLESMLPAEVMTQLQASGVDIAAIVRFFSVVGIFVGAGIGGTALLYLIFSTLAVVGRNWARILSTIMTVFFVLIAGFLTVVVVGAASSDTTVDLAQIVGGVLVLAAPAILALIGTILLFLPAANRFYRRR